MTDWKAAVHSGVPFIGRVQAAVANPFPPDVPTISDLEELAPFVAGARTR
jgi:hypothetical protein